VGRSNTRVAVDGASCVTVMGGVGVKVLGRKRAAVLAVALVSLGAAALADAAVVQNRPASSYQANGTVRKITIVGNTAYLGGDFTAMTPSGGGSSVTRNHAAAVNMTTGALLPWNPNVNGSVRALLANGTNIYVGGSFTSVGGSTHKNLAEVNGTTGAVVSAFTNSSKPNKMVRALVMANGNLYVGGAFTTPRQYLAEVNATTNTFIPGWAPVVDGEVHALATDTTNSRIVEGGFQNNLNGASAIAIGAVNTTTGASVPFAYQGPPTFMPPPPFPYRPFQSLAFAQDGNTLFVGASGNGGTALSINMEDGTLNYQEGFNGNVVGIGVTDGVLYMGGHFSTYCGPIPGNNFVCAGLPGSAARSKLAAVDEATGQVLQSWNPSVNSSLGIEALATGTNSVAVGGEFTKIGGVSQGHFARFIE
jgi:Domain of unknown function (DUF5122) beta-propeller